MMFFNSTLSEEVLHGSFHAYVTNMKLLHTSVELEVHYPKGWGLHLTYSLCFWYKLYGQTQMSVAVTTSFHPIWAYLEYTDSYPVHTELQILIGNYSGFCKNRIYIWKTIFLFPQKIMLENSLDRKLPILLISQNINCKAAYQMHV